MALEIVYAMIKGLASASGCAGTEEYLRIELS